MFTPCFTLAHSALLCIINVSTSKTHPCTCTCNVRRDLMEAQHQHLHNCLCVSKIVSLSFFQIKFFNQCLAKVGKVMRRYFGCQWLSSFESFVMQSPRTMIIKLLLLFPPFSLFSQIVFHQLCTEIKGSHQMIQSSQTPILWIINYGKGNFTIFGSLFIYDGSI